MNYQNHLLEIIEFLKPYQKIWQNEIMLMYPLHLDGYPREWIDEMMSFQDQGDVICLEKKDVFHLIKNPTLRAFYQHLEELCRLPLAQELPPMPDEPNTWLYIIPKKQHEIKRLAPHIHSLYQKENIEKVIDIGGGIGLLAQTLNNYFGLKVDTIDMDPTLQHTGRERHEGNAKDPLNKVKYHQVEVKNGGEFLHLLKPKTMTVGLHTCGGLAIDQIKASAEKKIKALINFGCCYFKMFNNPDLQNISHFSKEHSPLFFSKYALTLATRAHRKMNEKDFEFKQKVKFYRYGIHILFYDYYGIKELVSLGNSKPALYDQSFGVYALEQMKKAGIKPLHSEEELNEIFQSSHAQRSIQEMLAAGIIRNATGRVLELYILLDRALYLEEQGYQVAMEEFFDEELSPRNIGITASLST